MRVTRGLGVMIKSSQKFWVVYVRYRFIPEQCVIGGFQLVDLIITELKNHMTC